ncbi:MAG: hypothetical protein N2A97_03530 [Thermodesulfobacteriales bacterium]
MKNINAFIKTLIILTPLLLVFVIAGCNKEPKYIAGAGIHGIREPIFRILLSPVAYDGAIVVIEGVVQDFSEQKETDSANADDLEATFKLFDTKGSYINIRMPGQWEIVDNDYIIIGGIYRKNPNEIEAKQFEKVDFEDKDEKDIDKEIEKRNDW